MTLFLYKELALTDYALVLSSLYDSWLAWTEETTAAEHGAIDYGEGLIELKHGLKSRVWNWLLIAILSVLSRRPIFFRYSILDLLCNICINSLFARNLAWHNSLTGLLARFTLIDNKAWQVYGTCYALWDCISIVQRSMLWGICFPVHFYKTSIWIIDGEKSIQLLRLSHHISPFPAHISNCRQSQHLCMEMDVRVTVTPRHVSRIRRGGS